VWSQLAEFYQVISQAQPTTNQEHIYGFSTAVISRTQDSNEFDTIVSFPMPALSKIENATSSSTCTFVIKNPVHVTGSQNIELFAIGKEISLNDSSTQPFTNEYEGTYHANLNGDSTSVGVSTVPCKFGGNMQFIMKPQNDNDYIMWTTAFDGVVAPVGAFIEVRN
jgi:hypothetical protein